MDDPTSMDAEWKKIQQNTFTRWCNEHLKCVNQYIYSLETDFSDGLKLISLLQVLSQKRIAKYNKKPTFPPQKRENVAIALKFIEQEDIKLVNIGKFVFVSSCQTLLYSGYQLRVLNRQQHFTTRPVCLHAEILTNS